MFALRMAGKRERRLERRKRSWPHRGEYLNVVQQLWVLWAMMDRVHVRVVALDSRVGCIEVRHRARNEIIFRPCGQPHRCDWLYDNPLMCLPVLRVDVMRARCEKTGRGGKEGDDDQGA